VSVMRRTSRTILQGTFAGALLLPAVVAEAQVVRGVVRAGNTLMPIDRATLSARDSAGTVLGGGYSDPLGGYEFHVRADVPFALQVRRLGYQISTTNVKAIASGDTVDFEFLLTEVAAAAGAVVVTGEAGLNDRRLDEATRRGWKVYSPELVMRHRDRAGSFVQLLQSMGNPGLILPRHPHDCVRATRNNSCLAYVIDNQVMGNFAIIQPSDVYFFAILSAPDSRAHFGERAPYGAIVVYTRSRVDRVQPVGPPDRKKKP
jgi:hypothetical protein